MFLCRFCLVLSLVILAVLPAKADDSEIIWMIDNSGSTFLAYGGIVAEGRVPRSEVIRRAGETARNAHPYTYGWVVPWSSSVDALSLWKPEERLSEILGSPRSATFPGRALKQVRGLFDTMRCRQIVVLVDGQIQDMIDFRNQSQLVVEDGGWVAVFVLRTDPDHEAVLRDFMAEDLGERYSVHSLSESVLLDRVSELVRLAAECSRYMM